MNDQAVRDFADVGDRAAEARCREYLAEADQEAAEE